MLLTGLVKNVIADIGRVISNHYSSTRPYIYLLQAILARFFLAAGRLLLTSISGSMPLAWMDLPLGV